jgi:hypothetical protein
MGVRAHSTIGSGPGMFVGVKQPADTSGGLSWLFSVLDGTLVGTTVAESRREGVPVVPSYDCIS